VAASASRDRVASPAASIARAATQNFHRPKIFVDAIPRRDLFRNLLHPVNARIGFLAAVVEQKILRELSSCSFRMISSKFAG
jgi:hypothetical protein